jgi:hypothetical protein
MRSLHFKPGSGRIVIALLGLVFLKALGDGVGVSHHTQGRSAEAVVDDLPQPAAPSSSALTPPLDSPPTK